MHAYSAVNWLAMHCRRHMYLYGTTKEQLGRLAVNSRRGAALNPAAVYKEPITLDDYLAARPISDPPSLLGCDVPIDGSIAVVVSAADRADDGPNPPVRVEAIGRSPAREAGTSGPTTPRWPRPTRPRRCGAAPASRRAMSTSPSSTTGSRSSPSPWLEALGLCGDGEAGSFAGGGKRIALDGDLPLNTYGG
jgi:acetyl-CoA acetyltransferase